MPPMTPPQPPARTADRSALPAALNALADDVDAMAGRLQSFEAGRVAPAWNAYLRAMTDAVLDAAGDADAPLASALP